MLNEGALVGAYEQGMNSVMGTPVGQGVGMMSTEESVRDVFYRLLEGSGVAAERCHVLYSTSINPS